MLIATGWGQFNTAFLGVLILISAALMVAAKPKVGAWIVAAWLGVIILNLLAVGNFLDVALRDLGLLLGALALAQLSREYEGWQG